MEIARNDKQVSNIQQLIKKNNNDIIKKYLELKNSNSDTVLLSQYKNFFQKEKESMKSQIKALEIISKHLDKVSKMDKNRTDTLDNIKRDQKKVFEEILKIKKDFNKINSII